MAYTGVAWEEVLWGRRPTRTLLAEQSREAGWRDVSTEREMAFQNTDATAALIRWDGGAHHGDPDSQDHPARVVLWGQPPGGQRWYATFAAHTPTRLITAALGHLTDPVPALRRRAEMPAGHHEAITVRPSPLAPRAQAATRRTPLAAIPAERWDAAARTVAAAHANRPPRTRT
ncbi:DUF317 domain-containing protein [Kitasatospora sp. NPDC057015]|uniref:DUF317 domain-containing protein n=1 Tax=Kitasatospora sp. NPDC057015 TaxID=3346001 RepID=UPI0036359452